MHIAIFRPVFLLALLAAASQARAQQGYVPRWGPVDGDAGTRVVATGTPLDDAGVEVRTTTTGIGGAISSVDGSAWRGQNAELCATLSVESGPGKAMLWLRADRGQGFINGMQSQVRPGEREQRRCLELYIPVATSRISFGIVSDAAATTQARALRLRAKPIPASGASARQVLDAMFDAAQVHALRTARVDWPTLRAQLLTTDLDSLPTAEAYARFRTIAHALADGHSFAKPRRATIEYRGDAVPKGRIETHEYEGVGYVAVPAVQGTQPAASMRFASGLCAALGRTRVRAKRGWVIDLRGNGGGNMWPMLAGLAPLLGTDRPGAFRRADGSLQTWKPDTPPGCDWRADDAAVAVLIGPSTASSGEAVAVALRGRPHTRFFGARSAGLSTSNEGYPLPDGGSAWITTAIDVDRTGADYPNGVEPDEATPDGQPTLDAALRWLHAAAR